VELIATFDAQEALGLGESVGCIVDTFSLLPSGFNFMPTSGMTGIFQAHPTELCDIVESGRKVAVMGVTHQ